MFPQKYGHGQPVLFTYWTADNYQNTGAYNGEDHQFVQTSSSVPNWSCTEQRQRHGRRPGGAGGLLRSLPGKLVALCRRVDNTNAVGYYPGTLYQGGPMATGATEIDFGGETVGTGSYPPMGSGLSRRRALGTRHISATFAIFRPIHQAEALIIPNARSGMAILLHDRGRH